MARSMTPNRAQLRAAFSMTIRVLRKKKKLSQDDLAARCGIDRAYMSSLERAQHSPTIETIYKFLPQLDVSLARFAKYYETSLRKIMRRDAP